MSYFSQFWRKTSQPRTDHDKAWKRSLATVWDARWQSLSVEARRAFLHVMKPPAKALAAPQYGVILDKLEAKAIKELVEAGFARVEPASGKKSGKIIALPATSDFSIRLRAMERYRLLGPNDFKLFEAYIRYAFLNQGEGVIARVLDAVKFEGSFTLGESLELFVTTSQWPAWISKAINSKTSDAVLEVLKKAKGPVKLAELPTLVKGISAKDLSEALTDLVAYLCVFEGLAPETLEIMVGLLPIVVERLSEVGQADKPMAAIVCENPKEVAPPGGLVINDLRVFLLEIAGDAARLKQDRNLFAKEEQRFLDALPPLPEWVVELTQLKNQRRLDQTLDIAESLGFVETDRDDPAIWLRLGDRGRKWLSSGLEDQYREFYKMFSGDLTSTGIDDDDGYHGDDDESLFYGIRLAVHMVRAGNPRYYSYYMGMDEQSRTALRKSVYKAFESLPIGVFHRWESVLPQLLTPKNNPLTLGLDPTKTVILVNDRQIGRAPETIKQAGRFFLEAFLHFRLIPLDAFRAGLDDEGKLCVARLPRFAGYFGKKYDAGTDETSATTRVIIQPDFSVLVIGLDPTPAVEFAPFCDRKGGHAGQGALTFKITRESIVRASIQGLDAHAILARLKKYASVEIPINVTREIQEWAGWVRQVNVRQVSVIRCPDSTTASRVLSVLGKKAERLGETMVALHVPKLGSAERQKLQDQGILITKQDIVVQSPGSVVSSQPPPASSTKKRGRPRKV